MHKITFVGSTSSTYFRGKDKQPRKKRLLKLGKTALAVATNRNPIDREVNRYRQEGARTRLGKIRNDTKIGATTLGSAGILGGLSKGFNEGKGLKSKALLAITTASFQGLQGAAIGSGLGISSGITRGFLQHNKRKKK